MSKQSKSVGAGDQQEVRVVTEQLQELMGMTVTALRAKYQEVFGQPCHSRNKDYLRKKIGFRLQELAGGSLTERAKGQVEELAKDAPMRQRHPKKAAATGQQGPTAASASTEAQPAKAPVPKAAVKPAPRDPRLPPAGTVLRRIHDGTEHEVKVLEEGFEYRGRHYTSLSKVACEISGAHWNGFAWFAAALKAVTSANGSAA